MRLAVFCSGEGSNFENIVRSCPECEVVLMVHDSPSPEQMCGAVERAERLSIPHWRWENPRDPESHERVIHLMKSYEVDLIVLAGWMRIIKPPFLDFGLKRMINIHPSLLPKYKGKDAIKQALESEDTMTGCTVHYVTAELDGGPILGQVKVPICLGDDIESLRERVQRGEHHLYPLVINSILTSGKHAGEPV